MTYAKMPVQNIHSHSKFEIQKYKILDLYVCSKGEPEGCRSGHIDLLQSLPILHAD